MKKTLYVCASLALIGLVASLVVWDRVPDPMPIHWDAQGRPDGYASRAVGLLVGPAATILLPLLVAAISRLDPRLAKQTAWLGILTAVAGFMSLMHGLIIRAALSSDQLLSVRLLMIGMAAMTYVIGSIMPKIKQNRFAGIRTPWTLRDERNWDLTHRFGGWSAKVGAAVTLIGALTLPKPVMLIAGVVALMLGMMTPIAFSYALHKARPLGQ